MRMSVDIARQYLPWVELHHREWGKVKYPIKLVSGSILGGYTTEHVVHYKRLYAYVEYYGKGMFLGSLLLQKTLAAKLGEVIRLNNAVTYESPEINQEVRNGIPQITAIAKTVTRIEGVTVKEFRRFKEFRISDVLERFDTWMQTMSETNYDDIEIPELHRHQREPFPYIRSAEIHDWIKNLRCESCCYDDDITIVVNPSDIIYANKLWDVLRAVNVPLASSHYYEGAQLTCIMNGITFQVATTPSIEPGTIKYGSYRKA